MQKRNFFNEDFINKVVKFMSIIMLASILPIMLFIDTRVYYYYRNGIKLDNYILFL